MFSYPIRRWGKGIFLSSVVLLLCGIFEAKAQSTDYIVISDSIFRQGNFKDFPEKDNTLIYFKPSPKAPLVAYTVKEVGEFRYRSRVFYRRTVPEIASHPIFVEKVKTAHESLELWKVHGNPNVFLLEKDGEYQILSQDFREQLRETFSNPLLDELLAITRHIESDLVYLMETDQEIQEKRTFTRFFVITPHAGISLIQHRFTFPDFEVNTEVASTAPTFGLNLEAFVTFKRNLSVNLQPQVSIFHSHSYQSLNMGNERVEADINYGMTMIQIPVSVRYYLDLSPNKLRVFGGIGAMYSHSILTEPLIFQSHFTANGEVITAEKSMEMANSFSGGIVELGFDKHLKHHKALVIGFKGAFLGESEKSRLRQNQFYLGFKF